LQCEHGDVVVLAEIQNGSGERECAHAETLGWAVRRHSPERATWFRHLSALLAAGGAWFQCVKLLAWLKTHGFAGSDVDFGPGAGIAANAGFAGADAEDAKSAQFNALAGRQSLLEALEDRVHRSFSLGARQARALNHVVNDVLFDQ
jgi:hypothetical protein